MPYMEHPKIAVKSIFCDGVRFSAAPTYPEVSRNSKSREGSRHPLRRGQALKSFGDTNT